MKGTVGKGFQQIVDGMVAFRYWLAPEPEAIKRTTDLGSKIVMQERLLSNGVRYQLEKYKKGHVHQMVHMLKVDLSEESTNLLLSISNPINDLRTTEVQARKNGKNDPNMVAAVNASFFETRKEITGLPATFLVKNGQLHRFGKNSPNANGYNYQNQAFGVMPDGKARIGEHNPTVKMKVNGKHFSVFSIDDVQKRADKMVMFTPNHHLDTVRTQPEQATELVIENVDKDMKNIYFGTTITGKVTRRNWDQEVVNSRIPDNGFVLSADGSEWTNKLNDIQIGDQVSVTLDLESHWKEASFVIGSGPYLVKDGKRHVTMNISSRHAISRAPRTAIGVSKNGRELFLVTVDGRQKGYSDGMTILELADYFVSLGVDQALNLDGGDSTTMIIREPGEKFPSLINRPAAGQQREVSTTIQVIDSDE